MTRPRCIKERMTFYVTVRAVNRSFRFAPKREVRKVIDYCLSVVLSDYRAKRKLGLHEFEFMSNHYHLPGTIHKKCLPDFIRDLNSLPSRELNALRGISGCNIEKGYNLVTARGADRIIDHASTRSCIPTSITAPRPHVSTAHGELLPTSRPRSET